MAKKTTARIPAKLSSTPLWHHQRQAVSAISKYLKAFATDDTIGSALIHLPTGTGKTGVIACASHFLGLGCILVLCPRIALREQLARELNGRFFSKLGFSNDVPKTVIEADSGFPKIAVKDLPNSVLVMTIQMLHSLMSRQSDHYQTLLKNVQLVIVDEGHYEPAISWRDSIRAITAPKIIFTATPFRNDLKLFDVNYDHAYSYTLQQAVKDHTVRDVVFHRRTATDHPQVFVTDVLKFYDQQFASAKSKPDPPRVIIRCESVARIRQIGSALQAAGRSYVLIHENFVSGDPKRPHEQRSVPDPHTETAVFWVHQFKLLEGIDDSRFQLLAIFDELRTTRSLVQQVGRVIRNPSCIAGAAAHVLDHNHGRHVELWKGFLAFDQLLDTQGVKIADFGKKMLEAIRHAQPDVVYLDGRFRSRFSMTSIDPADELLLPCSVNLFRKSATANLSDICDALEEEYEEQDRDFRRIAVDTNTVVFIYLKYRNSPLLRSACFIECELGATLLRESSDYLCVYDSSGSVYSFLVDFTEQVTVKELRRLFPKTKGTHLTAVSLRNSNLGPRAIRSRSVAAARIEETLPTFDDHSFVCRTAQGYSDTGVEMIRRYVGFSHGKVTDSSTGRVGLTDYLDWLDTVTTVLASKSQPIPSFARFAAHAAVPADPAPTSILLDLRDIEPLFFFKDGTGTTQRKMALQVEDACCDVAAGAFSLTANNKTYAGTVDFQAGSARYVVDIPDLDQDYFTQEPSLKRGIVRHLNFQQAFRVIPTSTGSFYTLGEFYTPILKFGTHYDDNQIGLLKVLHPEQCLQIIGSEKGKACDTNGSSWDPQSLFSIVDLLGAGHGMSKVFGKPDLLVCDDLGTEAADFIAAYAAEKRVVFIHCKGKGSKQSLFSASGLQDVCGQASKNLRYFSRFGSESPPKASKWHTQSWSGAKGVTGAVASRVRQNLPGLNTGLEVWKEMQRLIRDPYSSLEVWLFLGRMLSKSKFEQQLTKPRPAPEAQQAAYLLFSTMNDVAAVGGRLHVFCSP